MTFASTLSPLPGLYRIPVSVTATPGAPMRVVRTDLGRDITESLRPEEREQLAAEAMWERTKRGEAKT